MPAQRIARWVLRRRPDGPLADGDVELIHQSPAALVVGQVRVRTVYISIDPTQRLWMSDREQYLPPVALGAVVRAATVGVVTESRAAGRSVGDTVSILLGGWESETVVDAAEARPVSLPAGVPLSAALSVLGLTGLTAWFGMRAVGRVAPGETVVVSAAAGAVGSIAGQIARLSGARVVGIAGGPAKCRRLIDELGFDAAIDYKNEDVGAALDRACPQGVDLQFENVGGPVMNSVFERLRVHGRVVLCGLVDGYDDAASGSLERMDQILMKRLRVEGLLLGDHLRRSRDALAELVPWVQSGALRWRDHVVPGLERAPEALAMLFSGRNDGKLMVQVSDPPASAPTTIVKGP